MPGMQDALAALAGPAAAPQAASLGMGTPPTMPGLPPPPTGVGAMPVGDPSTTKKAAADQCILALRECKGHYPELGSMLDQTVDAIKAVASKSGGPPAPALGQPSDPGTPPPAAIPEADSGTPGAM